MSDTDFGKLTQVLGKRDLAGSDLSFLEACLVRIQNNRHRSLIQSKISLAKEYIELGNLQREYQLLAARLEPGALEQEIALERARVAAELKEMEYKERERAFELANMEARFEADLLMHRADKVDNQIRLEVGKRRLAQLPDKNTGMVESREDLEEQLGGIEQEITKSTREYKQVKENNPETIELRAIREQLHTLNNRRERLREKLARLDDASS